MVYTLTLYPGVGGSLDSAEFQISGKILGLSHPTGYPLYHLITHLISNFPVASLAVRVSLFSSVCTALAALLVMVFVQQITSSRLFAYATTLLFITNYAVWHNATIAEVYAMQFLIHTLCLVLYSQWVQTQKSYMAVWLALCLGIGMAHHLMTIIVIIGIGLSALVFPNKHHLSVAPCYGSITAFIFPLLTFLYFPIRAALGAHSFDYYSVSTVGEFFHYVLGGNNTNLLRNDPFWLINNSMVEGMKYAFGIVGVFPVLLAVIGFYEWIKTKRVELILFLWLMGVHIFLVGIWTEADREAILVPVLLCATVLMAVGAQSVVNALQSWMPKQIPSPVIVVVLLGIVWVLQTYNTYQTISTRNLSFATYQYNEVYHAIPPNAVVLSSYWEETNAYKYLTWSGEYEEKDLKVFRWNDPRSNTGVEEVINYLRQQSAVGNPALSPNEQRPVVFLQPLDEENQSAFLSLNPIPVSENRFIYQAQLTAELSRDQKGYIPLSQLPWEAIKWNWMEPRQSLTLNGNPLMIADSVYHEGYGIHAGTQIQIPVPSGAKRFSCIIGVSGDLPPDAASTIIAMLSSDNSLLKRSPVLTVKSPKWELDYTLSGETVLLLEIWGTEDGLNADHAVLAEPRFYFEPQQ